MRIVKRLNNNAVLCVDDDGRQVIALGRGLSTIPLSSELDLNFVIRTFYDIEPRYIDLLRDLPIEYLAVAAQITDTARGLLPYQFSPNVEVALADHIAFAVQRIREGILLSSPLAYDIQQNYPLEYKIAQYALKLIKEEIGVLLPRNEASGIALSLINGAYDANAGEQEDTGTAHERLLRDITEIVEQSMGVKVDREGFGFARFATHILYLLKRAESHDAIETGISSAYEPFAQGNPDIAACVDRIALFIESTFHHPLTEEEKLYLFLHVNRICTRSDT